MEQNSSFEIPQLPFFQPENQRQQPLLGFYNSDGLGYQNQDNTTAGLQLAAQNSGGQRSKILLYQKPSMTLNNNQQNSHHHTTNNFHLNNNAGGSSAVSSVSNTAYGTLYQEQTSNRLQSQYFNTSKQNTGKQASNINKNLSSQNAQQSQVSSTKAAGKQLYGSLAQNKKGVAEGKVKQMTGIRESIEHKESKDKSQSGLRSITQQNKDNQPHNQQQSDFQTKEYQQDGITTKKSYQILKKPTTAQNQSRPNNQRLIEPQIYSSNNNNNEYQNILGRAGHLTGIDNKLLTHTFYSSNMNKQNIQVHTAYNNMNNQNLEENRSEYMNNINLQGKRPMTMGGRAQAQNQGSRYYYQSSDDNRSTLASEGMGLGDPRRLMKQRKQKLQSAFYDTLKQGQRESHFNNMTMSSVNNLETQIVPTKSQNIHNNQSMNNFSSMPPTVVDGLQDAINQEQNGLYPELNLYNQQITQLRMASGLSLKQNNLKYHLMRQLLQKKPLEEIMILQQKMLTQQQSINDANSKHIKFPGMMHSPGVGASSPQTRKNYPNIGSQSSSSSESSISEDVEPFVDESQVQTQNLTQDQLTNINQTPLGQTQTQGTHNQTNSNIPGGASNINNYSALSKIGNINLVQTTQMPTTSNSALGGGGLDLSSNNMGVLNSSFNINIIKAQNHSKKNSYGMGNNSFSNNYNRQSTQLTQLQMSKKYNKGKKLKYDKLTSDLNLLPEMNNQSCSITKYNYCGVPEHSIIDAKNKQIQNRKERIEIQKNVQINKGCSVYNSRSKQADINLGVTRSAAEQYQNHLFRHQSNNIESDSFNNFMPRSQNLNNKLNLTFQNSQPTNKSFVDNQQLNLSFALGSLDNKKLQQDVNLVNFMQSQLSYPNLQEKQKAEQNKIYQQKAAKILQSTQQSKLKDHIPTNIQENYDRLQQNYPTYGFDTADVNKMRYISGDEKDLKIYRELVKISKEKQQEYESMHNQEVVCKRQSQRQSIKSASSVGRKSLGGARGMILKDLLTNSFSKNSEQPQNPFTQIDNTNNMLIKEQIDQDDIFKNWGTINSNFSQILNTSIFGDFYSITRKEEQKLKSFIMNKFPVLSDKKVLIKIAKLWKQKPNQDKNSQDQLNNPDVQLPEYNCLLYGTKCPVSSCCKLSICININLECGTGKLLCMERLCQFNPLMQFTLPIEVVTEFYEQLSNNQQDFGNIKGDLDEQQQDDTLANQGQYELEGQLAYQIEGILPEQQILYADPSQPNTTNIRDIKSGKSGKSNQTYLQKQQEIINQELTKNVQAGSYRFKSLRNVVSRGGRSRKDTANNRQRIGGRLSNDNLHLLMDDNTTDNENDYEFIEINSDDIGDEQDILEQEHFNQQNNLVNVYNDNNDQKM
eukprot:403348744